MNDEAEDIDESKGESHINHNIQRSGRMNIIRVRIRNGKIQRRVKKSAVKGYVVRGGRLTRMSVTERRNRRLGARRAKIKRRAERSRIRMKTRRSMMRRRALGI